MNVKENDKNYEIEVAVPGMKKEDLKIDLDNGIITISAEKKDEKEKVQDSHTRREFSCNSFNRSFTLPQNADENDIVAKYEDGVLKLTIKKLKEENPIRKQLLLHKILIKNSTIKNMVQDFELSFIWLELQFPCEPLRECI